MYEELREKAHLLPKNSGVYIMQDADGQIIYIGKAKVLKNRVSSYFANLGSHSEKTLQLVRHISDFRVVVTKTEFDALLLEAQLIKQHKPKYNILLKDDKGFPFIRLGTEQYPKFSVENKKFKDKARYFGPYSGRGQAKRAIDLALNLMKLPTCARVFPRDFGKERPCLNYHMEKCLGFCRGDIPKAEFDKLLDQACQVLEGKYEGLKTSLETDMLTAAENLEFEKAAQLRDKLHTVERLGAGQGIFAKNLVDTDVLGYASRNMRGAVVKVSYLAGTLLEKETVFFDGSDTKDGADILESFVKQYYSAQEFAPRNILLSEQIADLEAIEEYLTETLGKRVYISVPQKGERMDQVRLAVENANKELELMERMGEKTLKSLEQLGEVLDMEPPDRIESFDISNTAGQETVCGMVVFEKGKPCRKDYKRFKINTAASGDDYGAIAEAVGRRLDRAINGDESFLPLPDLFLMDGGRGQVSAAYAQLEARGITIPIYGMVKDDRHRTRELTDKDGNLMGIDTMPPLFAFVTRIQDEVHRFAIDYHKKLRSNHLSKSGLDKIEGIGETRKTKLFQHFKTISAMKAASVEQLQEVVPKNVAQKIYGYFHNKEQS